MYRKLNPDFEIFFINDEDIKTSNNPYVRECLEQIKDPSSKYYEIFHGKHFKGSENKSDIVFSTAFSDAMRFMIIDQCGGIYLDCDTFPVKKFDSDLLLKDYFQCSSKWDQFNGPDIWFFGCKCGHQAYHNWMIQSLDDDEKPFLLPACDFRIHNREEIKMNRDFRNCALEFGRSFHSGDMVYVNHLCRKTTETGWWTEMIRANKK